MVGRRSVLTVSTPLKNVIRKQDVLDCFTKAQSFANKGIVCYPFSDLNVSLASGEYQRSVLRWEADPPISEDEHPIPSWGFEDYDFDLGDKYVISVSTHLHAYSFPSSGHILVSIDAPHCSEAIVICAFRVSAWGVGDETNTAVLLQPRPMTVQGGGTHTFVLTSDDFASRDFVDSVVSLSRVTFPQTDVTNEHGTEAHRKRVSISLAVCPVVFFDDHTRWDEP